MNLIYNLKQNNPDILSCLANLSNDEVFTPPKLANEILDTLPQNLFSNPDSKFLDPACKSGVFLREIAKRLIKGLEPIIPDLQARLDHIFHEQLFGIAITELTGMISRRTLYCSKDASCEFSVSHFDDEQGNIKFNINSRHRFEKGKCVFCGASQANYESSDRETHAYEFIHTPKPERIFNMKFDVVISNPPYQMSDGGGLGSSALPIYQKFIEQAKKLNPKYISMIIPARWYSGGRGLDEFREEMLYDERIKELYDFPNTEDCFPGVSVEGGICYFLWNRDYKGNCKITTIRGENKNEMIRPLLEKGFASFIRYNESVSIMNKIKKFHEDSFINLVKPNDPFGYDVREKDSYRRVKPDIKLKPFDSSVCIYYYGWQKNGLGYINKSTVNKNHELIDRYKVLISKAYGTGGNIPYQVLNTPFIAAPGSVCTETYLTIGPFDDESTAQNVISYIATKFFRFLVAMKKNTQNAHPPVYQFVPLQDFTKPWTDEELYAKYNLDAAEIAFIESMIKPMEV